LHIIEAHAYLILFIAGLLSAFLVLYLTATYVWPFLLGMMLAYLLLPLVGFLDRIIPFHSWKRGRRPVIVIIIFLMILGLIALLTFLVVSAIVAASSRLFAESPGYHH
jgi:predicted PurR-regulated permease PerM